MWNVSCLFLTDSKLEVRKLYYHPFGGGVGDPHVGDGHFWRDGLWIIGAAVV